MSYPTQPTGLDEIRTTLDERHPLGLVLKGEHTDELVTVVRVREHDIEVILNTGLHDAVGHDAIALVPDDFDPAKYGVDVQQTERHEADDVILHGGGEVFRGAGTGEENEDPAMEPTG